MPRLSGPLSLAAGLCLIASPAAAREAWLVSVEAPGALALSQPQRGLFGPGALPAAGLYRSISPHVIGGLRLRAGAFADGPAPADRAVRDPGAGGLGSLSLALRVRPLARSADTQRARGLWIEAAGGGGLTGKLLRATAEAGLGWNFRIGKGGMTLGPSLRYLQVIQPADPLEDRDARIALLGVEVGFFDPQPAPLVAAAPPPPAPPTPTDSDGDGLLDPDDRCPQEAEDADGFEDQDGCPDLDNDKDGIVDSMDRCPAQGEVVNGIDDKDGCPDEGLIELIGDRIVLEERVLFDTERARVKTAGRRHLEAIVHLWKQHPEWTRMTIEGHADVRGPDKFNDWLSGERADRVRAVLVELGMPTEMIQTKGYGETKPRDPSPTAEGHQQNRRVEFVIETTPRPVPVTRPTPAKPVEPAPVKPDAPAKPVEPGPAKPVEPPPAKPVEPPPAKPVEPPPARPVEPPPAAPPAPIAPPPLVPIAPPPFAGGTP